MQIIDLNFHDIPGVIACFLMDSSDGPILFECGPHSSFEYLTDELARLGLKAHDIRHLFVTHIHLDHAGAAWAFAKNGSRVYVHPVGLPHLADPTRLLTSARQIYQDDMDTLWGDMQSIPVDLLNSVDHKQVLTIGDKTILALHTPGHAKHHIAWQIEDTIISGDVGGVKIGNGPVVPPCPPPDIDIEAWIDSIELLKNSDARSLWLTHFGEVSDVAGHLNDLQKCLLDWSLWINNHRNGHTMEELVSLFETYINQTLSGLENGQQLIEQYSKANPAWMSVYGLVRYWKTKTNS